MGPQPPPGTPVADQLQRLVSELGSRLPAARAICEAEQRAVSDPLTGLRNRRELERALTLQGSKAPPIATLIYADLDHFKKLNDTLGHAAGDAALRHVARILEGAVRDKDLVARIGGGEVALGVPPPPLGTGVGGAQRLPATPEATGLAGGGGAARPPLFCGGGPPPAP